MTMVVFFPSFSSEFIDDELEVLEALVLLWTHGLVAVQSFLQWGQDA